jgi:hypothetical protein
MLSEPPRIGFWAIAPGDVRAKAATAQNVLSQRAADERELLEFKTGSSEIAYAISRTKVDHLMGYLFVSSRRVVEKTRRVKRSSDPSPAETSGLHAQHLPIGIDD